MKYDDYKDAMDYINSGQKLKDDEKWQNEQNEFYYHIKNKLEKGESLSLEDQKKLATKIGIYIK